MRPYIRRKQFVEVVATHGIDGSVRPRSITTALGKVYVIDEVKSVHQSRTGGEHVLRYRIRIDRQETSLFEDHGRWFVEMKEYGKRT